jgi:hypothetical protein
MNSAENNGASNGPHGEGGCIQRTAVHFAANVAANAKELTMQPSTITRRSALNTLAAGGLASALLALAGPAQAEERHPHIRDAIKALREARTELREGARIFGGHRETALRAVDEAIAQLEKALEFANRR